MQSDQYPERMLIVAKQGTNPWWPGKVTRCKKSNQCIQESDMNIMVYVTFLEINVEAWINAQNILRVSSREKMELILGTKHNSDSDNIKYLNNVPPTMQESYNKAWTKFNALSNKYIYKDFTDNDTDMRDIDDDRVGKGDKEENCFPCEICVTKEIEFSFGTRNMSILNMSVIDRSLMFSNLIITAGEEMSQCDNKCLWKYHSRCVNSNEDLVCGCNKSSWRCNICNEIVPVTQLFLCSNYECMRVYHKACIASHLELQPDTKQCPLHSCVNCRLDLLTSSSSNDVTNPVLMYCVKCKLAFHNHRDCLPLFFVTIKDRYIICGRHFLDTSNAKESVVSLCFTCSGSVDTDAVSCVHCPVTYHKSVTCMPLWIELLDGAQFICNGCKFPLARRWQYMVLAQSESQKDNSMQSWIVGVPIAPSSDCRTVTIRDQVKETEHKVSLSRLVAIHLQSLDHLVAFALARPTDIQVALRHLSSLVSSLASTMHLQQNYHRNAFVLHFSALFPVTENVYGSQPQMPVDILESTKCECTNYCSTAQCANVASKRECTDTSCSLSSRCRNRRIQRRHYPRQRLVLAEECGGQTAHVQLEEAVVKDVLVMEVVGEVKQSSYCGSIKDPLQQMCIFSFTDGNIIDNGHFCGLSRFLLHSDRPNLISKCWTVAGRSRIGLYSYRRIAANEPLTVDMGSLLFDTSVSLCSSVATLRPWNGGGGVVTTKDDPAETEYATVIDLCDNDDNESTEDGDDDDMRTVSSRRPLCPVCSRELVPDYAAPRAMIHCVNCYTVHHFRCAFDTLTMSRRHCRIEADPRLMKFVCEPCRQMDM